jgi:hypothetical protein
LLLFPNPNTGSFYIEVKQHCALSIYTDLGAEVYHIALTSSQQKIETRLASGLYFVRVVDDKGRSLTEKMVVE